MNYLTSVIGVVFTLLACRIQVRHTVHSQLDDSSFT